MAKVTQLLEKQQEILFVDFTDSRYSEEEMVQNKHGKLYVFHAQGLAENQLVSPLLMMKQ
jgi:hypothetical protein